MGTKNHEPRRRCDMEVVVRSDYDQKTGFITHIVDLGGRIEKRMYSAVHCGMSWPSATSPGYYIIIGEPVPAEALGTRFVGKKPPRGKLQVFCERNIESLLLRDLAVHLKDDCTRFGASGIFAEIDLAEDQSFRDERAILFRELLQDVGCPASLQRAPYTSGTTGVARAKDLQLSLSLVDNWLHDDRLALPEDSLARVQLRSVVREDLADAEVEPRVHAIRAVGHALAIFEQSNPFGLAGRFTPTRTHRVSRRTASRW
jgi:hypothetical protein